MDHRDEQLQCADCGNSFVFTAAEAAFYEERRLRAPPKRCKTCRAARKQGGAARGGAPPRYTGDINEYRSPMQDNGYAPPPAWRRDGRGGARTDGNYRAPSFGGDVASGRPAPAPRPPRQRSGRPRGGRVEAGADRTPPAGGATRPTRRERALFDITCSACGASSQVPFEPTEGREVFCKDCYVARKPT